MFILFPYALRYSFSSLCRLHLQCFFQNINACIRIPVMNCMTPGALPDTNAQIFHQRIPIATGTAGLAARIHRWYSVKFISIPAGFIFSIPARTPRVPDLLSPSSPRVSGKKSLFRLLLSAAFA